MKKLFSIILAAVLLISAVHTVFADQLLISPKPETAEESAFSDVEKGSDLDKALIKLKLMQIINGYEDGTFRAENGLTRAEFCKMVNKLFGYTEKAEENFSDVAEEDWYKEEVLIAKKQGYIAGFEDGTFRGNEKITREQVCVILDRINNFYVIGEVEIADTVSDWALEAVQAVISNGFMALEEGNTFRATLPITRSEFSFVFVPFVDAKIEAEEKAKEEEEKKKAEEEKKEEEEKNQEQTTPPGPGTGPGPITPPDMTADDTVIDEMQELLTDLTNNYSDFTVWPDCGVVNENGESEYGTFFASVKTLISSVITYSQTTLVTPEGVNRDFGTQMAQCKADYKALCTECQGYFNGVVGECATKYDSQMWMYFESIIPDEAFDIIGRG